MCNLYQLSYYFMRLLPSTILIMVLLLQLFSRISARAVPNTSSMSVLWFPPRTFTLLEAAMEGLSCYGTLQGVS